MVFRSNNQGKEDSQRHSLGVASLHGKGVHGNDRVKDVVVGDARDIRVAVWRRGTETQGKASQFSKVRLTCLVTPFASLEGWERCASHLSRLRLPLAALVDDAARVSSENTSALGGVLGVCFAIWETEKAADIFGGSKIQSVIYHFFPASAPPS